MRSALPLLLPLLAVTSACDPRANVAADEAFQPELAPATRPQPGLKQNVPLANLRVAYGGARESGAGTERFVYIYNYGPDRSGGLNLEVDGGGLIQVSRLHPLAPNHRRKVSLGILPCDDSCRVTVGSAAPIHDPDPSDNQTHLPPPRGTLLHNTQALAPQSGHAGGRSAASMSM